MWKYIRKYLLFTVIAALFMVSEVTMGLVQPQLMSQIVDYSVLGLDNNEVSSLDIIWSMGIKMILLVLLGVFCGSMNNVFVHLSGQNIGNEIRSLKC